MKAIYKRDRRDDDDKKYDDLWNKLCRNARLNHMQSTLVSKYLRDIIGMRIHEIESAIDMAWLISLIESEKFGTDVKRGAKRLIRAQRYARDVANDEYGKGCVNANGVWDDYDGCGLEHLKLRLEKHGVEYDFNL